MTTHSDGRILRYQLAFDFGFADKGPLIQLFPQRLGKIGHFIKILRPAVNPFENLLCPERAFPQLRHIRSKLVDGHIFNIYHIL